MDGVLTQGFALVACGGAKPDAKGPDGASGTKDAGKTDGAKPDDKTGLGTLGDLLARSRPKP